jgi:hypothetical protein
MYAVSESLSELGDALRLTTTDEAISVNEDNGAGGKGAMGDAGAMLFTFGRDDEAMEDSGVTSFTCVNGEEAVGDAGALVVMGDLPDGALDLKRRATMSNYDRRSDSSVRC